MREGAQSYVHMQPDSSTARASWYMGLNGNSDCMLNGLFAGGPNERKAGADAGGVPRIALGKLHRPKINLRKGSENNNHACSPWLMLH